MDIFNKIYLFWHHGLYNKISLFSKKNNILVFKQETYFRENSISYHPKNSALIFILFRICGYIMWRISSYCCCYFNIDNYIFHASLMTLQLFQHLYYLYISFPKGIRTSCCVAFHRNQRVIKKRTMLFNLLLFLQLAYFHFLYANFIKSFKENIFFY